jgi:hypothetical protein
MLRITVHDSPRAITFQLEGRLAGPWVRELAECWQGALARERKPILRVDLMGVTFISDEGKECLVALHREGAEFVAADCLTKAVVAEITHQSIGAGPGPEERVKQGWRTGRVDHPELPLKEVTMFSNEEQFHDTLRNRLEAIEGQLHTLKTNLQGLADQTGKALRGKLNEVQTRLQTWKEHAKQKQASLKAHARQSATQTEEVAHALMSQRETQKLTARADQAEAQAADAIDRAAASINEVEDAVLYAAVARLDADAAHLVR